MTSFDAVIVGGGLRGLHHALMIRAQRPGARVLVVESEAWPGDDVRTQRSNGFTCATSRPLPLRKLSFQIGTMS